MIRMLHSVGECNALPLGVNGEIKSGYQRFAEKHPGFDDDAARRARERRRAMKMSKKRRRNGK